MALVAYDFKRKTKDMTRDIENIFINSVKETKTCEALVRKGLLGPELALRFQPAWRRYLHASVTRGISIWQFILQRTFWISSWWPGGACTIWQAEVFGLIVFKNEDTLSCGFLIDTQLVPSWLGNLDPKRRRYSPRSYQYFNRSLR